MVGACALLAEYVTGLCRCSKRSLLILGSLIALVIFAFSITAIVKRTNGMMSVPPPPQLDDSVNDPMRFNAIRDTVLESAFTDAQHVDTRGTAQNLAIRWLTDDDPAKLEPDDDLILQRYALATFFFSTYVSTEYRDQNDNSTGADDFEWNNMEHWMTDKGICMWFGVTCPPHLHEGTEEVVYNGNNDIIHLNLTDNNIRGTIPSEIAALENLVTLDLGRNRLEGSIPVSIANMQFLSK